MQPMKKLNILFFVFILLFMLLYLFPLFWVFISALKQQHELFYYPPRFFPETFSFHWEQLIKNNQFFSHYKNSLILAIGSTSLTLLLAIGPAYVLAKYKNMWVDVSLLSFLVLQMLPPALMATPLYILFSMLHLNDSMIGVIMATSAKAVPFSIILLRTGFIAIPKELSDSAIVDGCNRLDILVRIYFPLAKNHIIAIGTLIFLQGMGEYVYAKSFLSSPDKMPITVLLSSFVGPNSVSWEMAMKTSSLYIIPLLLLFIIMQRRIMGCLTSGAVKG